jgi:hypothetical protein
MGAPSFASFAKGGYHPAESNRSAYQKPYATGPKRNLSPPYIHLHRSSFAEKIIAITAPAPLLRRLNQSTFHRTAMHVLQPLEPFLLAPHIEIIEAGLPKRAPGSPRKQFALSRISALSFRQKRLCRVLFQHLHHRRGITHLLFREQKVNVFGHDSVTDDHKTILPACLFENGEEAVAGASGSKRGQSSITRIGDKVQLMSTTSAMQSGGHGRTMVSVASHPPLQKAQGRGTHSIETGEKTDSKFIYCEVEGGTMTHRIIVAAVFLVLVLIIPAAMAQTYSDHGFLWTAAGGMQDLGVPSGWTDSLAVSISGSGEVAGYVLNSTTGDAAAAAWTAKTGWHPLRGRLNPKYSSATAINDSHQIAGTTYTVVGTSQHAFFWT